MAHLIWHSRTDPFELGIDQPDLKTNLWRAVHLQRIFGAWPGWLDIASFAFVNIVDVFGIFFSRKIQSTLHCPCHPGSLILYSPPNGPRSWFATNPPFPRFIPFDLDPASAGICLQGNTAILL